MRLIASLAAAAQVAAATAADRIDAWTTAHAPAQEPPEQPLGFQRTTTTDARGLTGEIRARWLAEVGERLNASTGGPWVTEERDQPTGRIVSPYGVIATGVERQADRDLIEDARADLYGLLALATYDDEQMQALTDNLHEAQERVRLLEHGTIPPHLGNRALSDVVAVVDAWEAGADMTALAPPEGSVAAHVCRILADARQSIRDLDTELARANAAIEAIPTKVPTGEVHAVREHMQVASVMAAYDRGEEVGAVPVEDGSLAERVVIALRSERIARAQAERKLDAHHRADASEDVSPFMNEGNARQLAHTIKVAMDMYDQGNDPMAALTLRHPLDLSGRVAELASEALRLRADTGVVEHYRPDTEAHTVRDHIQAANVMAATRIRKRADDVEREQIAYNGGAFITDADIAGGEGYVAGMRAAADIAADETPEADPEVAHIDTVNGRARQYTPGPGALVYGGGTATAATPDTVAVASSAPANLVTAALTRHGVIDEDDLTAAAEDTDTEEDTPDER